LFRHETVPRIASKHQTQDVPPIPAQHGDWERSNEQFAVGHTGAVLPTGHGEAIATQLVKVWPPVVHQRQPAVALQVEQFEMPVQTVVVEQFCNETEVGLWQFVRREHDCAFA